VVNHEDAWADVLPGLWALHDTHGDQDWSVGGVRQMLDEGEALLMVDDDDASGFAVLIIQNSPYHPGELELFILLMWHQGGKAVGRFCGRWVEMAHATGAKHIRFYSRRRGMGRLMAPEGFVPRAIEYVKEV
jgi:hypothetical protein